MRTFTSVVPVSRAPEPTLSIELGYEQRRRARLRVVLPNGEAIGLQLERGSVLREGDCLRSEDGSTYARVKAAPEQVSRALTSDPHLLARAAYHLGNRHVPLQILPGQLVYPHDHVLDGLCQELGLKVETANLPFEPELGGYGQARREAHSHHGHGHGHHHGHDSHHGHDPSHHGHAHGHDPAHHPQSDHPEDP